MKSHQKAQEAQSKALSISSYEFCASLWLKFQIFLFCLSFTASFVRAESSKNQEPIYLTLRDCIVMALDHNLEISIERLSPQIDAAGILQARGKFSPSLFLTPDYIENSTPLDAQSSVAAGGRLSTQSRVNTFSGGVEGDIPLGTHYNFGLQTSNSRSTFNAFRDQYASFWGLTLAQPLLKGFGPSNQLTAIRIARKQKEMSEEVFAMKVMDVVTRIRSAYHNLVFAMEGRRVRLQALELATKLLEDNRKRVQIGVMAPLEVIQAEAGVSGQEEGVILANQDVSFAMNELRSLISQNISEIQNRSISPLDPPIDVFIQFGGRDQIVETALELRPDYRQAKMAVERSHLQLKYDENQKFPQVDLRGSYGFNGLNSDFPESITTEDRRWGVGLTIRIPLPDQVGEGSLEASKLAKEKTLLQLKQVEQNILVEVDNALERVQTNYKRIRAARAAVHAANESLNAEMGKLKAGTTTSYLVLKQQQDLADVKFKEIQAFKDYNIGLAQLYKARGTTLRENDIELAK